MGARYGSRLAVFLLLSMAMHGMALYYLRPAAAGHGTATEAAAIQVRLLAAAQSQGVGNLPPPPRRPPVETASGDAAVGSVVRDLPPSPPPRPQPLDVARSSAVGEEPHAAPSRPWPPLPAGTPAAAPVAGPDPGTPPLPAAPARPLRPELATLLHREILAHRRYPYLARRQGREGTARIGFKLHPDGSISAVEVSRSSGHRQLDAAAERSVEAISPFPGAGDYLREPRLFKVDIDFRLRG